MVRPVVICFLLAAVVLGGPPPTPVPGPGKPPGPEAQGKYWEGGPGMFDPFADEEGMDEMPEYLRRALLGKEAPPAPPRPPTVEELTREIIPGIASGRYGEVETRLRSVLEAEEKAYGKTWPELGPYRKLLADFLDRRGRPAEAEALLLASLGGLEQARSRYFRCAPLLDLATHYRRCERFAKARETLGMARTSLVDAPAAGALRWRARLDGFEAELAYATGDLPRALVLAGRALEADTRSMAHPAELFSLELQLGSFEVRAGKLAEARAHLAQARGRIPPGPGNPGAVLVGLVEADLRTAEGKPRAALDFLDAVLLLVPQLDPWGAGFFPYKLVKGRALAAARRFGEAEAVFRSLLTFQVPGIVARVPVLEDLAACQEAAGKRLEAGRIRQELAAARVGLP